MTTTNDTATHTITISGGYKTGYNPRGEQNPDETFTAPFSFSLYRRYKTGDQFGHISKGSRIHRDYIIKDANGKLLPEWVYSSMTRRKEAKLAVDCLNSGLKAEDLNWVPFDDFASEKMTAEDVIQYIKNRK